MGKLALKSIFGESHLIGRLIVIYLMGIGASIAIGALTIKKKSTNFLSRKTVRWSHGSFCIIVPIMTVNTVGTETFLSERTTPFGRMGKWTAFTFEATSTLVKFARRWSVHLKE